MVWSDPTFMLLLWDLHVFHFLPFQAQIFKIHTRAMNIERDIR